jgi:hypothetical protein
MRFIKKKKRKKKEKKSDAEYELRLGENNSELSKYYQKVEK